MSENLLVKLMLKTVWEYWDELRKTWKNVNRKADETSVHDLRVASRRLGAALLAVESLLQDNRSSKARHRIKQLMKKLGPLRDVQVQISIVEKWKRRNLGKFKALLQRTERKERDRVREYLNSHRKERIRRSVESLGRTATKRLKDVPPATIRALIGNSVIVLRNDLKVAQGNLVQNDPKSLHKLRTTARKLRYGLEAAQPVIGAAPETEIQRLRQLQTKLGHRRDLQLLNDKFREWRGRVFRGQ